MIIFLKLGGSIITDKSKPYTADIPMIRQLVDEIDQAVKNNPEIQLIIGHGSGSFGHVAAHQYQTQNGVSTQDQWAGFVEVWKAARQLNEIVTDVMWKKKMPVISFQPSSMFISKNKKAYYWNPRPIEQAISKGIIPVIYGDVIFDNKIGGTIFSTEDLFFHIIKYIKPNRILVTGKERGVYQDFPENTQIYPKITPKSYTDILNSIKGSENTDVTGGMATKISRMIDIVSSHSDISISIFSVEERDSLFRALNGEYPGTTICQDIQES